MFTENSNYFNKSYYKKVIKENGYSDVEFKTVDFALKNYDVESMQNKFLCHYKGDDFAEAVRNGEKAIVTTGFGMSGLPHLGSMSQVVKICELNRAGMTTQVVLGDLDSYNARNQTLEDALHFKDKFQGLFENIGYKLDNDSIIRDQYSHPEINHTAYLISKYIEDKDFQDAKEDIAHIYEKEGIYDGWSFAMKQALTLMIADFIHLHTHHGYNHIMVMLGLEEHKYVRMATKVIERMGLPIEISGIYGRIIKGLSGYPKMSKSLKGSAIDVSTSESDIYKLLLNDKRNSSDPRNNATFLIMEQVSFYNNEEINTLIEKYEKASDLEWSNIVKDYIENQLLSILRSW